MKIGIDVSQLAYENTGVANFYKNLIQNLVQIDEKNEYVLFFSSFRRNLNVQFPTRIKIKKFKIPPTILNIIWNKLHIFPIEMFVGDVDVFVTSDWTEPPARKAKKATVLYDLVVFRYPDETDNKIINVQKRKLEWVKRESSKILCISEATKKDAKDLLGLTESKLEVIYPGL